MVWTCHLDVSLILETEIPFQILLNQNQVFCKNNLTSLKNSIPADLKCLFRILCGLGDLFPLQKQVVIVNHIGSVPTSDNPVLSYPITFSLLPFPSCFGHLNILLN